jgi:hypothetical protein
MDSTRGIDIKKIISDETELYDGISAEIFAQNDKINKKQNNEIKTETSDNINPSHYSVGNIFTIDYIEAKMTNEMFEGYLMGNVIKYISRYRFKNGKEDLMKAKWYLSLAIERCDKK